MTLRRTSSGALIDRLSGDDMMQLASDTGPVPWQVGAVLRLDAGPADVAAVRAAIAGRIVAVPRLRQVLVRPPPGCGRPVWVDDAGFDVEQHVRLVRCPAPGDEAALLRAASASTTERLPPDRPLWRATVLTGLAGGDVALVLVIHHVLADGLGGLAVLAELVDGAPAHRAVPFPRPAPSRRELAVDAFRSRLAACTRAPAFLRTLPAALVELNPAGARHAPRTTLNSPTGGGRRVAATRADLARLHETAHAHGATVNDVVLTAITGALGGLLVLRGEHVDSLVVSVPVSGRVSATTTDLGNQAGVMPVSVPVGGDRLVRLHRTAAATHGHRTAVRGASAVVLAPAVRVLAAVGALQWFINRQQVVNVYETNLRGPAGELWLAGHRITEVLPLTPIAGNVATSFAAMSCAGTLTVTITVDADQPPDLETLRELLQGELDALASADSWTTPPPRR